jgi:hypothetical protein
MGPGKNLEPPAQRLTEERAERLAEERFERKPQR